MLIFDLMQIFVVSKLKKQKDDKEDKSTNDDEVFLKENFKNFNFPFENQGSFTVRVEDKLAEVSQECLGLQYGEPRIVKNANGTECDQMWKFMFGQDKHRIEITVHFYNHKKPKDKKQSKILLPGYIQSSICEYVFVELPKISKMVSSKKTPILTPLRYSKRKTYHHANAAKNY